MSISFGSSLIYSKNHYILSVWVCLKYLAVDQRYQHCTENHILKDSLPRKITLEYDPSCIIKKDDISFSRKYDLTR